MRRASAFSITLLAAMGAGLGFLAASAPAHLLVEAWRLDGLSAPESAFFDKAGGRVIVSQMGASGPESGRDGKLVTISPEGELIDAEWVTGLLDPKGMASHEGRLYVADLDGLHVIDMATGEPSDHIKLPDAVLPNDVAVADEGTIYVSDILLGAIYRVRGDNVDQVVAAGDVSLPNGLFIQDGTILVGTFGEDWVGDLSMDSPAGLLTLDPEAGTLTPVAGTETSGRVDGIAVLGDWLVFDDYPTGHILGWRDGTVTPLGEAAPTAADLGSTGDVLLVPVTDAGEVIAYRLQPD